MIGGVQQIKASIDFHAFSELILWPFGHTRADTAPGLTQDDRDTFATLGESMARTNGYTAQQSSDLYITDGALDDWLWGEQTIFAYTFEMYPAEGGSAGFYPADELIGRETSRNREAVLLLLENAACPQAVIGKAAQYCGTAPLTTLFAARGEAVAADRADRRRELRRQLPLSRDQAHEQRPAAGQRRRHAHAVPRARAHRSGGRRRRSASAASPGAPCAWSSSPATPRSTRLIVTRV